MNKLKNDKMPYSLWLNSIVGITVKEKKALMEYFDSAVKIYKANTTELERSLILSNDKIEIINKSRREIQLVKPYKDMTERGISYYDYKDNHYPTALKEIPDYPLGIFHFGKPIPNENICVAIVGSRRCTTYGSKAAEELAYVLGKSGFTIVSGMARGIDSHAHCGAVKAGAFTVAVLGCGVDVCYPPESQKLYMDISKNGCIISEYPLGQSPLPKLFPQRNRIISGMSRHIIVTEARAKSGSLITADLALQYNRNVYAVPGRMYDPLSEGTNLLIENGANLITSPENMLKLISQNSFRNFEIMDELSHESIDELTDNESIVLKEIDYYSIHRDDIEKNSGFTGDDLTDILDSLTEKTKINEIYSGYYVRK
ncbi:MAG: DNA-processing protein DprA [Lachnospiraceae bacterium]|nr:DNA-processing protein DprA [Lachnospiraceae bacterium]